MQRYSPEFRHRFLLIEPNKRLKFVTLYIVLTIIGIFLSKFLSRPISVFTTLVLRVFLSSPSNYESATAFGLIGTQYGIFAFSEIIIKCTQWYALFRYGGIEIEWPIAVIVSQLLRGFITTFVLGTYGPGVMQILGLILLFIPSVAEFLVLSRHVKYAWLWLVLDGFSYLTIELASRGLRLYADESPIFLIINLLIFAIKLICLCLFYRKDDPR